MTDRHHSEQPSRSVAGRDATGLIGRVRQYWEEVLDPASASPSGDFLGCGGDSLRAVQLCQRLQATLGRSVSPGWLLSTPGVDIAGLAAELAHAPAPSIPPADTRALAEPSSRDVTSFSQERMWFMHQLAPEGLAYNVSQALRLIGPLRADALEHAVQVVTARYPVLYSRFAATRKGLRCLAPTHTPEIRLERIQPPTSAADEPAEALREMAARLVRTPFDLVHGPVFRAALIQAGDADAVLLLWAHHIVADQWAFDILVREIAEAYHPDCEPQPPEHSEMMPDFGAYAAWHRDWFQRERLRPELAYWRRQLQGLEPLVLPADRPRPAQQTFRGRRLRHALDPGLRDRLQVIAAGQGATLAMLLLAALKLLLRTHCDRSDLAVGVPVANRQHPGAGDLVGTLVNTLVVRSDISACDDTLEVLAVVRRTLLEALEHQDLPFERLVQAMGAPRDTATSPLFTVMFNMLNTPLGEVHFEGLTWQRFEVDRQAAQFDLTVTVDADVDRSIVFEYSTDLFEPDSMARLVERYFHLLGRLAEEPRRRLTADLWLPPAEREELDRWGTGPRRDITPATLQALVASALQRPQGMALQWAGEKIPVTTLEHQSAALAARLNRLGIGRGALVGVCLPRGPAMLVALLGVIRAGAAYVPLDPCYPTDRLHYMAEDAALAALVANRDTSTLLAWPATPQLLLDDAGEVLEDDGPTCSVPPSTDALERAGAAATGEDPAYVIYTSGSSGRPKGVVVPQAAVVNFLLAMAERPGLGEQDRLLAVTTPSFDIAVLELFLPLWTGATLVLATQEDVVDGTRLAALIRKARITALQATPSTWRMMLEAGWQGQPGLKALVGGESLAATLAYQLAQRTGEVWNMYGPTETTVWSSCWRLPPRHEASISLGSPILNTSFQVVDSRLQPCPIGVPGELLIGGAGVARGYLHEADLTTARFVALPGVDGPVYRTGDRVRWSADGALEYLGRLDAQVKLRGHRIELGEIEDRLGRHPAIAGAVAAVVEDRPGDARLLAYIVPWRNLPRVAELRDYLAQWLPSYMLPQHFVELDAMPLLPNGKVDRANLPAATAERVASAIALREAGPATPLETALHRLWCEVLDLDDCNVTDSFFILGGHSMLAVRLASRIQERLGYTCDVATLFRHPEIRSLAGALEQSADRITDTLVALQPLGERDPIFCLCGVSLYARLAQALPTDRPVYGVFADSELGFLQPGSPSAPSVEELGARYLELIRARQPDGPVHLVGFSLGSAIALDLAHRLSAAGQPVGALILLDGDAPGQARQRFGFRVRRLFKRIGRRVRAAVVGRAVQPPGRRPATPGGAPDAASFRLPPAAAPERPFTACIEAYRPTHYLGGAVFVEARDSGRDASHGWAELVHTLKVHQLASDHLGLLLGAATDQVAVIVTAELERFDTGRAS